MLHSVRRFLLSHEYLIWILCLCAILRLPSLLEPYWYGDEGIYLTLGQGVRQGLHLYKDIHDNKPPVIYVLAALTGTVFWFRFLLLLWNSLAIVAFERLSRMLFSETDVDGTFKLVGISFPIPRWSTLATLLFAVVPFFVEGAIANGEIFMIMPVIVGMLYVWKSVLRSEAKPLTSKQDLWTAGLAGVFFSLAFLIKVPSLFDAFCAGLFLFIILRWRQLLRNWKTITTFCIAFLLPIACSVVYYSALGVGKQYVAAAFAQNIGYLSSWATGTHTNGVGSSGLKIRAGILVIVIFALFAALKKNGKVLTFLLLWLACSLFGALLSERPYPHYLIQIVPPLTLLIAYVGKRLLEITQQKKHQEGSFPVQLVSICLCVGITIFSVVHIRFWYYPVVPYYSNYIDFVTGKKTKSAYLSYFDARLPDLYAVSSYIQSRTTPEDRIFAWGDIPMIYALSRRLPPGRYTSSYHIKDFNGFSETIDAAALRPPKFIVIDTLYEAPFPQLKALLNEDYISSRQIGSFVLYRYFPHQVQ